MRSYHVYCLLTLGGAAFASPTRSSHHPSGAINRRLIPPPPPGTIDDPSPSPYPGSDTACTNEPLYVNFDYSKEADKKAVDILHSGFCNEWPSLAQAMDTVINTDTDRTLFERYFSERYVGTKGKVYSTTESISNVNKMLYNPETKTAQPLVKTFIFDNDDFEDQCPEHSMEADDEDARYVGAYSFTHLGATRFHFCEGARELPALSSIQCESLDASPSIAMESVGRVIYHEFLHHPSVDQDGPDDVGGPRGDAVIRDLDNKDEFPAYYPERVHGLRDSEQDNTPNNAPWNADNYAWLAANAYFKYFCAKHGPPPPNHGNYNKPAHYKPGVQLSLP